jgi:hypothetical protein
MVTASNGLVVERVGMHHCLHPRGAPLRVATIGCARRRSGGSDRTELVVAIVALCRLWSEVLSRTTAIGRAGRRSSAGTASSELVVGPRNWLHHRYHREGRRLASATVVGYQ